MSCEHTSCELNYVVWAYDLWAFVVWAYVLWAFVLWAYVLWAFVVESHHPRLRAVRCGMANLQKRAVSDRKGPGTYTLSSRWKAFYRGLFTSFFPPCPTSFASFHVRLSKLTGTSSPPTGTPVKRGVNCLVEERSSWNYLYVFRGLALRYSGKVWIELPLDWIKQALECYSSYLFNRHLPACWKW